MELAALVRGMAKEYEDERISLGDALRQIEALLAANEASCPTTSLPTLALELPTPSTAAVPVDVTEPAGRLCMICEDSERSVRFACGHSACCDSCVMRLRATAEEKRRDSINPALPEAVREKAAAQATPRCPVCSSPLRDTYAESGPQVATTPTFVMPTAKAAKPIFTGGRAWWLGRHRRRADAVGVAGVEEGEMGVEQRPTRRGGALCFTLGGQGQGQGTEGRRMRWRGKGNERPRRPVHTELYATRISSYVDRETTNVLGVFVYRDPSTLYCTTCTR